jgi:5,10-methylenetetrahydromethanopterin reductase
MKLAFGAKPKAPVGAFVDFVEYGENLGYDAAWFPDQTFFPDPFVSIAISAMATKKIELVIGVVNPYTRNPVQVARAVATLDDIAPNRIALGYGAGNRKELIIPLGVEQINPVARCREAVSVCKQLLQGSKLQYRSSTLTANGVELQMPAHPQIPLYIVGRGPKMLQLAGELADTAVIGALWSIDSLQYAIDQIRIGVKRTDRKFRDLRVMSWITCYVTDDKQRWIDFFRPSAAHILAGAPEEVLSTMKLSSKFIVELKTTYSESGSTAAAKIVPDELVEKIAAIGKPMVIAEQINCVQDMGITELGILVNAPDIEESMRFLKKFIETVWPKVI